MEKGKYFEKVMIHCTTESFLKEIRAKYHYEEADAPTIRQVAEKMQKLMSREARWEHRIFRDIQGMLYAETAMTLGEGVDALQEDYLEREMLSEAYMIEALGSEILLQGYREYNKWIAEHTPYHVARYHFLGSEKAFPLEQLPRLLKRLEISIACNDAFCMMPKKSVAFVAELTDRTDVQCQAICTGCGRQDCPNRMETANPWEKLLAGMPNRVLPYGYVKILGL